MCPPTASTDPIQSDADFRGSTSSAACLWWCFFCRCCCCRCLPALFFCLSSSFAVPPGRRRRRLSNEREGAEPLQYRANAGRVVAWPAADDNREYQARRGLLPIYTCSTAAGRRTQESPAHHFFMSCQTEGEEPFSGGDQRAERT